MVPPSLAILSPNSFLLPIPFFFSLSISVLPLSAYFQTIDYVFPFKTYTLPTTLSLFLALSDLVSVIKSSVHCDSMVDTRTFQELF